MIQITNVRNARYFDDTSTSVDLELEHPEFGWIPYLLTDEDTDTTINNDELLSLLGDNILPYIAPTQDELDAIKSKEVRYERERLLDRVDAVAGNTLRWADLTAAKQAEWAQYRTELLDVPQQSGFPNNITWPTEPT